MNHLKSLFRGGRQNCLWQTEHFCAILPVRLNLSAPRQDFYYGETAIFPHNQDVGTRLSSDPMDKTLIYKYYFYIGSSYPAHSLA